jgi:hypothetical protein
MISGYPEEAYENDSLPPMTDPEHVRWSIRQRREAV